MHVSSRVCYCYHDICHGANALALAFSRNAHHWFPHYAPLDEQRDRKLTLYVRFIYVRGACVRLKTCTPFSNVYCQELWLLDEHHKAPPFCPWYTVYYTYSGFKDLDLPLVRFLVIHESRTFVFLCLFSFMFFMRDMAIVTMPMFSLFTIEGMCSLSHFDSRYITSSHPVNALMGDVMWSDGTCG